MGTVDDILLGNVDIIKDANSIWYNEYLLLWFLFATTVGVKDGIILCADDGPFVGHTIKQQFTICFLL